MRSALLGAGLLIATLALCAPASAAGGYRQAVFKAEVEGVQRTSVTHSHEPLHRCDVRDYSTGKETVRFASRKPLKVTVARVPGVSGYTVLYGKRGQGIPTRARVNRRFSPQVTAPPSDCPPAGDGNGGGPLPPDCGTRTISPWMIAIESPRRELVSLEADHFEDPYQRCPGGAFPELVHENTRGDTIVSRLPEKELFDQRIGKLIVIGRGERSYLLHDYDETTTVRWSLSLRRIG